MEVPRRLPDPTQDEIAASAALCAQIAREVRALGGFMPFERFMEMALFEPPYGYYVGGAHKFGAAGDFLTAPEISPLFGRAVAAQCVAAQVYGRTIVEFGGGSGRLAASVLEELAHRGALPARYLIVELSPAVRARQQALLAQLPCANAVQIDWLSGPPAEPVDGIVLANEILDALPTTVFRASDHGYLERGIGLSEAGQLVWQERPAPAPLAAQLAITLAEQALPAGHCGEINLRQPLWIADLARFLRRGVALLFDYGGPRAEIYHPVREVGTLRCYWRHRLHDDPLWLPGLQDLTASVDFTAAAEAALEAGFHLAGYATQASFLLANGIERLLAEAMARDPTAAVKLAAQAKQLLLPTEMGTTCKVLALGIGVEPELTGFSLRDERHRL